MCVCVCVFTHARVRGHVLVQTQNAITHVLLPLSYAQLTPRQVIGSALAVASSLVMGKEGPMLHAGSILAVILGEPRPLMSGASS